MCKAGTMAITMASIVLLLAAGCAHIGRACDDHELIREMLATWIDSSVAQDVERMMSLISEDFSHDGHDYEAADKTAMAEFIEDSIAMGNYDDLEITYEPDAVKLEGDTAEVHPIDWVCTPGNATIGLTLKKEKGAWRIIDATVEEM